MLLGGVCVCLPVLLNVFVRIGCKSHTHFFIADRGTRGDAEPAHLVLVGNPSVCAMLRQRARLSSFNPQRQIRDGGEAESPARHQKNSAVEGAVVDPDPDAVGFYLTWHFCLFAELIPSPHRFLNAIIHPL